MRNVQIEEAADCTQFETLSALADARPDDLIADRGYDSDAIRDSLDAAGVRPVIPPRSNRTAMIRRNKRLYRQRNRIERLIGHLKINRAIANRRRRWGVVAVARRIKARRRLASIAPVSRLLFAFGRLARLGWD